MAESYRSILVTGPQTGPEGELHTEATERGVPPVVVKSLVRQISPAKDLVALIKLWRIFRRERPLVVHTHSSKAGIVGRLAAKLAGVPVVVHTVHGWPFHEAASRTATAFYVMLERMMAPFADRLIVVADHDLETGLQKGIGKRPKYRLVPNGIEMADLLRIDRQGTREPDTVGSVMRLSEQKDPMTLMRAAARVAERYPDVRFKVAGDGPLRPELEEMSRELRLQDRFDFLGIRRDLDGVLGSFDVFVATSKWEGMPRAVVSAMAAGLPVIAAAVGGLAEVVQEGRTGYLFEAGDAEGLADRLIELLADQDVRARLGAAGREAVRELDVSRMIERTREIYEESLGEKDPPDRS
jgi:glycosyltransferase involved in cell wall biosynthesis